MAELTCPKCRKTNPEDALICQYCDTPLVTFLPRDPVDNSPLAAEPIVQGETQPTIPDWLAAIRDQKQKDGINQPVPEESESSDQEKSDLDSWLEKLRASTPEPDSTPSNIERPPAEENPESEGIDTPAWLSSIRSKINTENPTPDESSPSDPGIDWLTKLRKQTEELSLTPESEETQGTSSDTGNEGISLESRLPDLEPYSSTPDNNEPEEPTDSILSLVTKDSEDTNGPEETLLEESDIPEGMEINDNGTLPSASAMFDDSDQPSEKITTKGLPDWLSSFIGVGEGENTPESALLSGLDEEAGGNGIEPGAIPSWVKAMRPVEQNQGDVQAQKEADRRFEDSGPLAGIRGILPVSEVGFNYSQPTIKENRETSPTNISVFENTLKTETEEKKVPIYKRSKTSNVVRWIIAVILLLVVILIQVGGNPPDLLPKNLPEETMAFFRSVSGLSQGANILLVLDYDPAYSGEIEVAVNAPISLMMVKQANLFTLSTAPTSIFLADNLLKSVVQTHPTAAEKYVTREKYQVLGYLPGGQSGMQNLLRDFKGSLPVGLNLEKTVEMPNLTGIKTLNDFEAIMILTDNPDTARIWVEQVGPTLTKPAIWMVVSSQVIALVRPYVRSGQIDGLISGVYGAASFEQIIQQPGAAAQIWNGYYTALLLSMVMIITGGFVNFIGFSILRARNKSEKLP
jgi:hypothetical protein